MEQKHDPAMSRTASEGPREHFIFAGVSEADHSRDQPVRRTFRKWVSFTVDSVMLDPYTDISTNIGHAPDELVV